MSLSTCSLLLCLTSGQYMIPRYNYIFLTADKKYLELKVASVDNAVIHCTHSLQAGKTHKNIGSFTT